MYFKLGMYSEFGNIPVETNGYSLFRFLTHPVWHVISFDSDNRPSSSFLCEVYLNMWIDSYTPQKIVSIGFNKWTILSHVFIVGIRHYMKVMLIGQRFYLRSSQLTRPASLLKMSLFHRCFSNIFLVKPNYLVST